jgi:hypothetical protein
MSLARDAQRLAETQQRRGAAMIEDKDTLPPGAKPIGHAFMHKERLAKARREDVFRAEHRRRTAPKGYRAGVGIPGGEVDKIARFVVDGNDDRSDKPEHGADFASEIKRAGGTKKNIRDFQRVE